MRIVLDTNIFVSAILKANSVPAAAIQQVCTSHTLLTSLATQREIRRVLAKPYFKVATDEEALLNLDQILANSELVQVLTSISACRDPMDNKFLELAFDGKANLIITGDNDLLSMGSYEGILIMTAAQFLVIPQQ